MRFAFALFMAVWSGVVLTLLRLDAFPREQVFWVYSLLLIVYAVDNWWLTKQQRQSVDARNDPNCLLIRRLLYQNSMLHSTVKELEARLAMSAEPPPLCKRHPLSSMDVLD
jgi:hypothetical protein